MPLSLGAQAAPCAPVCQTGRTAWAGSYSQAEAPEYLLLAEAHPYLSFPLL